MKASEGQLPQMPSTRAALEAALLPHGVALEWVTSTGSTNTDLLQRMQAAQLHQPLVLVAERQHAGRGTHGRTWSSAHRCAMFSLAWPWPPQAELAGLSLAVGLVTVQALEALLGSAHGLGLKWPNDVWLDQRKLGGVLIESRMERAATAAVTPRRWVVIGVGINVDAPADVPGTAGLAERHAQLGVGDVLLGLLTRLPPALQRFEREGWAAFAPQWPRWDALCGQTVRVEREGHATINAVAQGVDARGALRLSQANIATSIVSGRVSLLVDQENPG